MEKLEISITNITKLPITIYSNNQWDFYGQVLTNNKIYSRIFYYSSSMLEVDILNKKINSIPTSVSGIGGVVNDSFSNLVFYTPQYVNSMKQYDTQTKNELTFVSGFESSGMHRWQIGSINYNTNKLYLVPNYDSRIIEIDLLNKTWNTFYTLSLGYKTPLDSIIINNKLYVSSTTNGIYSIDLINKTYKQFSNTTGVGGFVQWNNDNNFLFVQPGTRNEILVINTISNEITDRIPVQSNITNKWFCGVNIDDTILFIPNEENRILVYNIIFNTISYIPISEQLNQKYQKILNNKIVTIPYKSNQNVFIIDFINTHYQYKQYQFILSKNIYNNKYYNFTKFYQFTNNNEIKFINNLSQSQIKNISYRKYDFNNISDVLLKLNENIEPIFINSETNKYFYINLNSYSLRTQIYKIEIFSPYYKQHLFIHQIDFKDNLIPKEFVTISFDNVNFYSLPYVVNKFLKFQDNLILYVKITLPKDFKTYSKNNISGLIIKQSFIDDFIEEET